MKVELTELAERSNKGDGMRESNCYESTLEDVTQSNLGIGVSVVVNSKDCEARWPGCKSNSIAYWLCCLGQVTSSLGTEPPRIITLIIALLLYVPPLTGL